MIVGQEDNAETRQGNLIAQQETLQQQLVFAKQVESAKVVEPAGGLKASAHSKKTSLVIGALIGLILGAIVAIAGERPLQARARPMLEAKRVAVVVPAHNEEELIVATLQGIPGFVDHVYVVDDASTDETAERAARRSTTRGSR